jgi:predicted nucleic acid-binding protein
MVLTDTGFWYAFFNQKDKHHLQTIQVMQNLDEGLITTWPVITETCYLLGKALGVPSQLRFISALESDYIEVSDISIQNLRRIQQMIKKYADLPMDLADASLVILAEELGHGRILSTDQRDFRTYRWKNHNPFQNLLLPDY